MGVCAGGCVYKGLNRAIATASAAVVALGVHWIASKSGDKFEPFIRSGSVFLLGTCVPNQTDHDRVCTRMKYEYD